jgi:DNA-binding MarR family transcriptional regulator
MTTIAAPDAAQTDTRATLLAYLEALTLAEPLQERIWQLAQLTLTQVSVLRELRDEPKTAGKAVGLSPTSVTRLVDRLERRGLVSRHREFADRRLVEIRLDPAGERLLGEIKVLRGSPLHRAVEAMTRDERRNLTTGLRRLVELARDIAARDKERG